MIHTIYFIILAFFLLGGIGFFFINRKKESAQARKSWIKFGTYFLIIHILFFSIVIYLLAFRCLAVFIIIVGFYEMFKLFRKSGYKRKRFFLFAVFLFGMFSFGFFFFSGLGKELVLFSFLILSIFDSFSQITGQLWGRKKIFPEISSQKTREGLLGGGVVALLSALLLESLIAGFPINAMWLAGGVVIFAFLGDFLASFYKRKYNVKDFSNLIPGHGGVLDRFDSLIVGGAGVALLSFLISF
jgi:phosphatidate cytidylyltransferase